DLLDLVAEELDAERLAPGGREDVDEPAANGEVAALLDPLDAFVARRREALGEHVDPRLVADGEPERRGARLRRREALGDRGRGGADEAASLEHRERPRALADEVRRRLEPRAVAHAPRREERDGLVAEEPAGRLGGVAGVGVLGQED